MYTPLCKKTDYAVAYVDRNVTMQSFDTYTPHQTITMYDNIPYYHI